MYLFSYLVIDLYISAPEVKSFFMEKMEKNSIRANCKVSGELPLNFTWTLNGAPVTGDGNAALFQPRFRESVLYIENANEHNIGRYTCNVSNILGHQTATFLLGNILILFGL